MLQIKQNHVAEWVVPQGPATVTAPGGETCTLRSFQKADGDWYVRYASPQTGIHTWRAGDASGTLEVMLYEGDNPLYKHGAVRSNGKYLEHADGTPFFWLADTWWMGLTTRLPYPDGIAELAHDRVEKGFTAVQIVAGLYPDMPPFDPRGKNEAGFPWKEGFTDINPAYFDAADKKITYIIEQGLMPCIVACWGYYADFCGKDVIRRHWDELLARWAAYPVMWCIAGEVFSPFYNNPGILDGSLSREAYTERIRAVWVELTEHVRREDPFRRLITAHAPQDDNMTIDVDMPVDVHMLETAHEGLFGIITNVKKVREALDRGATPLINAEINYEGICGSCFADVQRYTFLSDIMMGCCGHTYGANGIWQFNTREAPYGPSPHGNSWGDLPWQDAYKLLGSTHVGRIKKFFTRFPWWALEPHPEWVARPCNEETLNGLFCVGIPETLRIVYLPYFGWAFYGQQEMRELDGPYYAYYYCIASDELLYLGMAKPDDTGRWVSPPTPLQHDWLLALTKTPLQWAGGSAHK